MRGNRAASRLGGLRPGFRDFPSLIPQVLVAVELSQPVHAATPRLTLWTDRESNRSAPSAARRADFPPTADSRDRSAVSQRLADGSLDAAELIPHSLD